MDDTFMKIMYADISTDGHHLIYLNNLLSEASSGSFAVLPKHEGIVAGRCHSIARPNIRTLSGYWNWILKIKQIALKEQPDIIHLLDGDSIMRYFGFGLGQLKAWKVVITFHHLFPGVLRKISMRRMLRLSSVGVFHTEAIEKQVRSFGCKNVRCIPYPCFFEAIVQEKKDTSSEPPVLLALGGTRYDKGLDIFLEALKLVDMPFRLIIAGKEEDFHRDYIEQQIQSYKDCVELNLKFLSSEEVLDYLQRSDIIVLPYRKIFDGASGPMNEGIYLGKMIIGPAHGSLGEMIRQYHVGYTFKSENVEDLAKCLQRALKMSFLYDETAKQQQKELNPELFRIRYQELYRVL